MRNSVKSMIGAVALSGTGLLGVSPANASIFHPDYASKGAKLDQGMTEAQVSNIVGHEPYSVSLTTCGGKTGSTWTCKIETFGSIADRRLIVYFARTPQGAWIVNNWDAF